MSDDEDWDDRLQQRREAVRRWMMVGLLIVALGVAIWGVYWIGQTLGLSRIGEFYKQADDIQP